jgi:hypothetical protein
MKKFTAIFAAIAIVASLGLTSCKKCTTCTAKNKTDGSVESTSLEACGNKKTIDDFEAAYKLSWEDDNTTVTCE